mmetsp:Transcript_14028/g.44640  ORF Transcript_14028/g.44640 Transcript_14028/m.44640 type:complete len:259 (+) Transcript_14028:284-1060(+)
MLRRLEKRANHELALAMSQSTTGDAGSRATGLAQALARARVAIAGGEVEGEGDSGVDVSPTWTKVPSERVEGEVEKSLSWIEKMEDEALLALEWVSTVLKPQPLGAPRRRPVAWLSSLALTSTYFYMAGQWQSYLLNTVDDMTPEADVLALKTSAPGYPPLGGRPLGRYIRSTQWALTCPEPLVDPSLPSPQPPTPKPWARSPSSTSSTSERHTEAGLGPTSGRTTWRSGAGGPERSSTMRSPAGSHPPWSTSRGATS